MFYFDDEDAADDDDFVPPNPRDVAREEAADENYVDRREEDGIIVAREPERVTCNESRRRRINVELGGDVEILSISFRRRAPVQQAEQVIELD